ncbi:hypothetical protein BSK59_13695 [Paenibacillus odorifer]|nr:hypothetical protein BSK59_13695 [Paenibacillus odorifer]
MMLPQHKERINEHRNDLGIKTKPTLHTDEKDIISRNISSSLNHKNEVTIEIFGARENRRVIGVITSVSEISGKMKVDIKNGYEWIDLDEILTITCTDEFDYM